MCDESVDVFADEIYPPEYHPEYETDLSHWNLQQPAWKPFKTWSQLTNEEKFEVTKRSV